MKRSFIFLLALAAFAQSPKTVSKADVERWMTELSNWGRWGKQDQVGTVNLITAAKRKQAVGLVKEGLSVSLARTIETKTAPDNSSPFQHTMQNTGANPLVGAYSMDTFSVLYHGYGHTHMDALCHMFYQGKMYNGFSQNEVTNAGAQKLSIANFQDGIVSRAILMDIPRLKGVPYLEPGQAIYPEDLDAWEKKAGVKVGAGDILLIRTGRWARRADKGPWDVGEKSAGLHASCMRWIKQRDVAILGSDAASDVMPSGVEGVAQPIHQLTLIALGTPIFDNCDLEKVSETANRLKRWEFMVSAGPLPVPGGTGSPMNPLAIF
jgi:kynurenine formamidase